MTRTFLQGCTATLCLLAFVQFSLQASSIERDTSFDGPAQVVDSDCDLRAKYCKGSVSYNTGDRYEGELKFGEAHGWGTFAWGDGTVYIGEFTDGLRHGHGQQNFTNGDNYSGDWKYGHMHGKGVYDWTDGSKYVGSFAAGHMEGKGIITLPNGESYDGEWKQGLAHGEGEYAKEDGSKYKGKYKSGQRDGTGVITWRTGDVFVGKWRSGNINKKGTFHFNNGDKYFTTWEEGEMMGNGTYIFVNGREIEGDPLSIEQALDGDEALMEEIAPNLGLTWYTIALEYVSKKQFNKAMEHFELAQKYVPKSSDLNKLIHNEKEKIKNKMAEGL